MNPGQAGSSWKERRESMGKTIDQVSTELRIAKRYLAGIEEGNFKGLPERVFSIGFIRTYAKYLSEDPAPVLAEYDRSVGDLEDTEVAPQLRFGWVDRERERGSRRATYTVAAGCVLLLGVILAWMTLNTERRPLPPPSPAVALPSPPPVDNAAAAPSSVVDNGTALSGTGPLGGPFRLLLEASELTWVMYSLDDGDPIDVMLYPGDKISINAEKRITVKLGNAGGLAGTLNGRRLPPFGDRGQVRKITIGQ